MQEQFSKKEADVTAVQYKSKHQKKKSTRMQLNYLKVKYCIRQKLKLRTLAGIQVDPLSAYFQLCSQTTEHIWKQEVFKSCGTHGYQTYGVKEETFNWKSKILVGSVQEMFAIRHLEGLRGLLTFLRLSWGTDHISRMLINQHVFLVVYFNDQAVLRETISS